MAEPLTWVRKDKYYQAADGYWVSAAKVGDTWRFTAWKLPTAAMRIGRIVRGEEGRPGPVCLGHFDTADEARQRCQEDAG